MGGWCVFGSAVASLVYQNNIRVTIIEPGLVATELPQQITHPAAKEQAKNFYGSVKNLESEDIANAIVYAVTQPLHVNVNEILIRPTEQER